MEKFKQLEYLKIKKNLDASINDFNSNIKSCHALLVSCSDFDINDIYPKLLDSLRRGVNALGGQNVRVLIKDESVKEYILKSKLFGRKGLLNMKFKVVDPSCLDDFINLLDNDSLGIVHCNYDLKRIDDEFFSKGKIQSYIENVSTFTRLWHYQQPKPEVIIKKAFPNAKTMMDRYELLVSNHTLALFDPYLLGKYFSELRKTGKQIEKNY